MQLSDFDYDLPDALIAQAPLAERRASRLLEVDGATGALRDRTFAELPERLAPGDLLVVNDTRVIPARLRGHKASGGQVELLLERLTGRRSALVQLRASRAPRAGSVLSFADDARAEVVGRAGPLFEVEFDREIEAYLETHGDVPLPPYIDRPPAADDALRYQTVYAQVSGAVAAPTAGLHFDVAMFDALRDRGVDCAKLTLHVGLGTFSPVRSEDIRAHRLHAERVVVDEEACEAIRRAKASGGRVVAVGTTVVRALEAAASSGAIEPLTAETALFIYPGYEFRVVDGLITNFHLPRSSLLMLIAAFVGHRLTMAAYRHAVAEQYRFFSYGDAMLAWPASVVR